MIFPSKFMAGPVLMVLSTSISEYKVQEWFAVISYENPTHVGMLSALAQIMLQIELSRLLSYVRITSVISVVCTLYTWYLVLSNWMKLSSCDPQFFRTKFNHNKLKVWYRRKIRLCNILLFGPVVVVVVVVVVVEVVVTEQVFRSPLMWLLRPCRTAFEDLHQQPVAFLVKNLAVG